MIRTVTRYAAALVCLSGAFSPLQVQANLPELPGAVYGAVSACPEEDSTGCVWQADERGNGRGATFYAAPDGRVFYVSAEVAAALVGA
jgi:hypothetical protein